MCRMRARLLEAMQKRFQPIANLSLIVLILTGMVQTFTNRFYKGFLQFDNHWAQAILFKHLAVLGMIVVAGFITFSVQPALRRNALLIANGLADEAAGRAPATTAGAPHAAQSDTQRSRAVVHGDRQRAVARHTFSCLKSSSSAPPLRPRRSDAVCRRPWCCTMSTAS